MNRLTAVIAALSTIVLLASEPAIGPAAGAQVSCSAGQQMMPKGKGTCANLPAGAAASGCPSGVADGTGGCAPTKITITCAAGQQQLMPKGTCVNLPAGAAASGCPSGVADGTGGCVASSSTITCAAGQQMMPKGKGTCANLPAGAAASGCPSGVANGTGGCAPATGLSVTAAGINATNLPIVANTCGAARASWADTPDRTSLEIVFSR